MELSRNWKSQIVISKIQMRAGAERHRPFFCAVGRANGACGLSASLFCCGEWNALPRALCRGCAWNGVGGVSASGVSATLPSASCVGLKISQKSE